MYVHCNGITLYYEVAGEGPAILFVHGNGEDHRIFAETKELLTEKFTVYALDLRGHGKSFKDQELSYEVMAEDVVRFVMTLKIKKPVYCGFSDGAILGILAASQYPQLFHKMVLCGANAFPEGLKSHWLKLFALMEGLKPDPKTRLMLHGPRIFQKELGSIQIPTLILAGERDMIRESHTRFLFTCIKNSALKIIPGETHGSYVIHSRKLYYHMKGFIEDSCKTVKLREEA